jgi:RecJ-like exonuclease
LKKIITILVIIYLITQVEPPIKEISELKIGDYNRVTGTVKNSYTTDRLTIINLTDGNNSIKTIFFSEIHPRPDGLIEVTGRVKNYKGTTELTGVKIKYLD